jgi:hypothetical protein
LCHSSLWLSKFPLCMYINFLIHSSVLRHLGCFHSLAIVNNNSYCLAVMSIGYIGVSVVYRLRFLWVGAQERCHWIIWQFYL